jgi:predicted ABC-type ATPase
MNKEIPRLRMFAGPNGSGKSTFKSIIPHELIEIYINPDEIEKEIHEKGFLEFQPYRITTSPNEVLDFFTQSPLLKAMSLLENAQCLRFNDEKLIFHEVEINAYFASVAADFIRNKLIQDNRSFTFETVMSNRDKIELLRKAQIRGYRTYLYYIATEDTQINISRVQNRVQMGGHSVPEDKIVLRYRRSLDLLMEAVQFTNRAYIFDNSAQEHILVAEITNGKALEMKTDLMPTWFRKALWDKFHPLTITKADAKNSKNS